MYTIKEIIQQHEKAYIIFKSTESRRRFVSDALKLGILFTDATLPCLDKTDDIIALYSDGTIAHLGWAGRVHFHADRTIVRIEY